MIFEPPEQLFEPVFRTLNRNQISIRMAQAIPHRMQTLAGADLQLEVRAVQSFTENFRLRDFGNMRGIERAHDAGLAEVACRRKFDDHRV